MSVGVLTMDRISVLFRCLILHVAFIILNIVGTVDYSYLCYYLWLLSACVLIACAAISVVAI